MPLSGATPECDERGAPTKGHMRGPWRLLVKRWSDDRRMRRARSAGRRSTQAFTKKKSL